ncbi:MAG: metallophosphoesterase family protein [Pseudomonadota bacterium]
MVWLTDARPPRGMRIYAIGDVHGCLDDLKRRHEAITNDLIAHPVDDWRIVLLGDLIDRGPDSPGVLDWLDRQMATDPRMLGVRGNHDTFLIDFLADPMAESFWAWASYGGATTLAQYGMPEAWIDPDLDTAGREALHAALSLGVPDAHRELVQGLPLTLVQGDYLLVHAGIRPGSAIEDQVEGDLIWIREPFLMSEVEHSHVIVHGHTVGPVTVRPNRIGIDTGCVWGNELTCLVLDGADRWLLNDEGRASLPGPV